MSLTDYRFVSREIDVDELFGDKVLKKKAIFIGILNKKTGIVFPHPVTNFIKSKYEYDGKSLNSQAAPAQLVCRFMNFIYENIEKENAEFESLRELGIRGLKGIHASRFITSLTVKGSQKNTVKQYRKYIDKFYEYLKDMGYIDVVLNWGKDGNENISVLNDPQLPTMNPSRDTINKRDAKLKDFGENRRQLVEHFISIARKVAPDIAFGLCLQFYGGLRRGETVNITREDIKSNYRESLEVEIRDNRKVLFSRLKDTKFENPKRLNYLNLEMSKQTILDDDLVWEVYDDHIKTLKILDKKGVCKNKKAFFVDKDGNPMSAKVYERRFKKVKKAFLHSLIGTKEYDLFDNTIWSTHIGRGVFTNLLISMGFTVTQIAIARGDRNINSAMSYVDETLSSEQIKQAVNEFKHHPIERLGELNIDDIKRLWKGRVGK
ncbi:site-specific integrase [Priestia filamentosa]|uniref:site-specific integrase n=1 Tax=Priestia filamentosa TaxID=1402861 RepID=UPI0039823877